MAIDMGSFSTLLPAGFLQAGRLLDLLTPLGPDRLLAESVTVDEQIGQGGYRIDLSVLCDDAQLDLNTLMGQPIQLSLKTVDVDQPRLWCGHVTAASFDSANGGMARYRLRVEPWIAFLRVRRDSFAFQDKTVFEIVESIAGDYAGRGKLAPQWRWDIKDRADYPVRSLTTQYRESDFDFVERLLAEEGLFYWFEHEAGADGEPGKHVWVIADHNGAFQQNEQFEVRFHRADATETRDTVQAWRRRSQWGTNAVQWSSWDYRSMNARPVGAQAPAPEAELVDARQLIDRDYAGQYGYEDGAQGERLASNAMAALRVAHECYEGEGTVRSLRPGTRLRLQDHWNAGATDDPGHVVLAIRHEARNNFDEGFGRSISRALGGLLGWSDDAQAAPGSPAPGSPAPGGPAPEFYRNRFTALHADIEYRPLTRDQQGARIHPRPTVVGAQTALVVGDNGPVHTDRDHRIKVQFHWQRGRSSSNRLAHPSDEDNAPASNSLGTWVRVAEPVAGPDWGGNWIPRKGQEVLVEFLNGDIDRPVVVGGLYNGEGAEDAAYNSVQGGAANATGNAPAWFAGGKDGHAHNAVMSGFKTQALSSSGQGSGGYNQLVFDDSPGQVRTTVSSTLADSRLNLGHIKQQRDNERLADRGHGGELASREAVAVRAGAGLLVSADLRAAASGPMLDSKEAITQIEQSREMALALAQAAGKQSAVLPGEPAAAELPALAESDKVLEIVKATQAGGDAEVPAYSSPHLQFSAPAGIGQYTPADAHTIAGQSVWLSAPHVNWAAGADQAVGVAEGLVLFTLGQSGGSSPVDAAGLRLHAASGSLSLQAQDDALKLSAKKAVTIASTHASVEVRAAQSVLATAGGAYLRFEGGRMELHAPGKVELLAGAHNWGGPRTDDAQGDPLPDGEFRACGPKQMAAAANQDGVVEL